MKTRVAIVGLGGVADRIHLPACRSIPEIEVVAGCDPNEQVRQKTAAKFGLANTYSSLEPMLAETKPDAVIVGTPPDSHFEICRKSLEAGAHVLCEKPFMQSVEEADRIIEIARRTNRLLRVNNQYRYMSFYAETKRRLLAGEFGRLFYLQAWQHMFHPPAKETNWRSALRQYVIYEFGTHALDLASFFFDALPESVQAHTPRARPEFDADVLVNLALRFPEERLAAFSFNRISHAPEKYLEMRLDCEQASIRISLGGVARFQVEYVKNANRPMVQFGWARGGQARVERDGASRLLASAANPEIASATAAHLRVFLQQAAQPNPAVDAAWHARGILRLVFAAYESAASGETVWLNRTAASAQRP